MNLGVKLNPHLMFHRPLFDKVEIPTHVRGPRIRKRLLPRRYPLPIEGADVGKAHDSLTEGVHAVTCSI